MTPEQIDHLIGMLRARSVIELEPGLTEAELARAEARIGVRFPPDLAALLRAALPLNRSDDFPDWRRLPDSIDAWMDLPIDRFTADIESRKFWLPEWGRRPISNDAAVEIAERHAQAAPHLIPIFGHRFIPAEPHAEGNPVLSTYGADIIVYGNDLGDYLAREFGHEPPPWAATAPRPVRFWDRVMAYDDR